jgi:hypothetical protein
VLETWSVGWSFEIDRPTRLIYWCFGLLFDPSVAYLLSTVMSFWVAGFGTQLWAENWLSSTIASVLLTFIPCLCRYLPIGRSDLDTLAVVLPTKRL